jgi:hypothetical protein
MLYLFDIECPPTKWTLANKNKNFVLKGCLIKINLYLSLGGSLSGIFFKVLKKISYNYNIVTFTYQ